MAPKICYMPLNYKVVAAVFVTLLAVAVGMKDPGTGVGSLDASIPDSIGDILDLGGAAISPSKTPNISINATFSVEEDIENLEVSEKAKSVRLKGKDAGIELAGLEADVDNLDVILANFTGDISFGENLSLTGTAGSMEFNSLPFTSSEPKEVNVVLLEPSFVSVDKMRSRKMEFSKATGRFSFGGGDNTLEPNKIPVSITSFEGVFARNYSSGTYSLDGKIFEAVVGEGSSKAQIGG